MSAIKRIDDIEVLRAFAVLMVVIHHLNGSLFRFAADSLLGRFFAHINAGIGVDLFFAISGFVIARSMLPRFSGGVTRQEFKNLAFSFWTRRVFRLLPSAWLWLFIILALQIGFNQSGVFGSLRANVEATIAAILQVANVRFAVGFMQFELGASFVYWSLSLEEQFYLIFPFLALLPRRKLFIVLAIIICVQQVQERGMWLVMFRTDALCFGILVAMLAESRFYASLKRAYSAMPQLFYAVVPLLIILLNMCASEKYSIPGYDKSVVAILAFLLVLIASMNANIFRKILPFNQAFLWIGARSYAIYLMHIPIFYSIKELYFRLGVKMSDHVLVAVALSLLLIAICAELNFRYVEEPMRRWGANLADQKFGPGVRVPSAALT